MHYLKSPVTALRSFATPLRPGVSVPEGGSSQKPLLIPEGVLQDGQVSEGSVMLPFPMQPLRNPDPHMPS